MSFRLTSIATRMLVLLWACPNSALGLACGGLGLASGGKVQLRRGCLEFYGGVVNLLLARAGASAVTLGHTILGRNGESLDRARDHEHVHVRQYERWGPLFLPAYVGCAVYLWLRRRDPYRDNPFEIEAYNKTDHPH